MVRRKRQVDRLPVFALAFAEADWPGACLGERYAAWRISRDAVWAEVLRSPGKIGALAMLRVKRDARRVAELHARECGRCTVA